MKTHMLSKASLTFFPLAERKLDLKHTELSRRMREAEAGGTDRLGRRQQGLYGESRACSKVPVWKAQITPGADTAIKPMLVTNTVLKGWLGFLLGGAFVAP